MGRCKIRLRSRKRLVARRASRWCARTPAGFGKAIALSKTWQGLGSCRTFASNSTYPRLAHPMRQDSLVRAQVILGVQTLALNFKMRSYMRHLSLIACVLLLVGIAAQAQSPASSSTEQIKNVPSFDLNAMDKSDRKS